ncbi:ejaculatory bulb-specific protein 3-like [Phymastichus coffea]|uniref:ejaculatory bulb-specific protein 3-like n=1 Tax=Phymastichus coffea TaxID=108790 RepID=UPI00273C1F45|nr:ejaculatory bulb-specific protein 3-like [Phymastichus coffea]
MQRPIPREVLVFPAIVLLPRAARAPALFFFINAEKPLQQSTLPRLLYKSSSLSARSVTRLLARVHITLGSSSHMRASNMSKICSLVLCCVALILAVDAVEYTNKYDNVDVDRILQNGRVLSNYIKCMLDEGNCTPDGREFKRILPDALASGCNKCNEKQKATADKVINHLMKRRPADWERLLKKYDPKGEFKKRFEAQGRKI